MTLTADSGSRIKQLVAVELAGVVQTVGLEEGAARARVRFKESFTPENGEPLYRVLDAAAIEPWVARCRAAEACAELAGSQRDHWLNEARDLFAALRNLSTAANTVAYCYDNRPENFAAALKSMGEAAGVALKQLQKSNGAQPL